MARGSLAHLRRSFPAFAPFMADLSIALRPVLSEHLMGQMCGEFSAKPVIPPKLSYASTMKCRKNLMFSVVYFAFRSIVPTS
jgi:hypothetical protein